MGLTLPTAPMGTQGIVARALSRAHSANRFTLSGISGGAAVLTPVAPHRVYVIGIQYPGKSLELNMAKLVGWRTIVLQGSNPVAAVEFSEDGTNPSDFTSLNQGRYVESTGSALAMAEGLPQVQKLNYEPRILQVPSIYLSALWLHGDTEDLMVPLSPTPGPYHPYQAYSEREFFQLATGLAETTAKRRLGFSDKPQGIPPAVIEKRRDRPNEASSDMPAM